MHLILGVTLLWLALGVAGAFFPRNLHLVSRVLFPAGALGALALAGAALNALGGHTQSLVLPLGLPDLPFHLRLDALSAFFLLLLGAVTAGISVFAAGYFRRGEGTRPACCVCISTCSSPAWRWCCSPTTPMPSWCSGKPWPCRPISWSRAITPKPRSGAPVFSTC
jgi:formate hydrogenlyase subunit 3/multisubunit Na+/H+ antiporter MnhD subunit